MGEKQYFKYGSVETDFLKSKDMALRKAIEEIGHVQREIIPDMFMALINSIIGQQISTKAQKTVWTRFLTMFAPVAPVHIFSLPEETLQTCGTSLKKAAYIKEIARSIVEGSLDLDQLQALPDDAVCKRLTRIKGIGVWTAEMLMIFSMHRMDIMSWGDMAILRGLRMLHRHKTITPELFTKYKKRYSPYGTVASLYLWKVAHGACKGLVDRAPTPKGHKKMDASKSEK